MKRDYYVVFTGILLIAIFWSSINYYQSINKESDEKCGPCGCGGMLTAVPERFSENTSIDTRNGGFWLFTINSEARWDLRWEKVVVFLRINDVRTINCSGDGVLTSYTSKKLGIDDSHGYYICEGFPGGARYDLDFGVDGETNRLDSSFTLEHVGTLENVSLAIIDMDDDGEVSTGDTIYVFSEFNLGPKGERLIVNAGSDNEVEITCYNDSIYSPAMVISLP
jgi:hypothetical protein